MKVIIEKSDYKGIATLSIRKDTEELDRYPFYFGLGKAKLLQAAFEQDHEFLKRFITEEE